MTKPIQEQIADIQRAIAAQESVRAALDDASAEAILAVLHEKLAALEKQATSAGQTRRVVTVLFADVSGFTAMAEAMDAEEVGDLMNDLWQRLDGAIAGYGGQVDKHIGDAVMAVWGAQEAREDDAEQAIRAALAILEHVAEFNTGRSSAIRVRIGVNTGPALLGQVGTRGEFSAIGDTVNVASRLQHAAPLGGILISHDAYRYVRGVFDVLPQPPLEIKGRAEPVQAYVVQCAKAKAFRVRTRGVEGVETHMVGRDAELSALQAVFRQVVSQAQTHWVTILGEAGVGKSRLLYEFDEWLELQPERFYYFKGRATPAMQSTPYSLMRDMLAYRFDIRDSDSAALVLDKFRAGMAGVLEPDQADLVGHWVGFDFSASPAVQKLLSSPSFGQLARAYLTRYIRQLAAAPADDYQALVMFLEDLHWADEASLSLIEHLASEVSQTHWLLVCLARPQLFEHCPDWGRSLAGQPGVLRLDLRPLSDEHSAALVDHILQRVDVIPGALRAFIVNGAEGNPFYVEELIKMLIENGVVVRDEQCWHVTLERLGNRRMPPTLTGLLQARLDSLPAEERAVLQRASVVGRQFWDAAVAALAADTQAEAATVKPALDAIQQRELIFRQPHSAFDNAGEYLFKHALLRDVTYETVLIKLRRVYHTQAARWLEANAGERIGEYRGLIAGHYERAGERLRAADYLQQAGEAAYQVSAYREAVAAFEHALEIIISHHDQANLSDVTSMRASLLVWLGDAHDAAGNYSLAIEHFQEALALASRLGNCHMEIAALSGLGKSIKGQSQYSLARTYLEQALVLAREVDDRKETAHALYHLGDMAYRLGNAEEAQRCAAESLAICKALGKRRGVADALRILGFACSIRQDYEAAERYYQESIEVCGEIGDRRGRAAGLIDIGEILRKQARYAEAAPYYEASIPIAQEIGSRRTIAVGFLNLGHTYAHLGKVDEAWSCLHRALEGSHAIGAGAIVLEGLVGVALLQAQAGCYEAAAEILGLVQNQPAFNAEIEYYADHVLDSLRIALPATQLEAALARGRAMDLESVVAAMLAEPQPSKST